MYDDILAEYELSSTESKLTLTREEVEQQYGILSDEQWYGIAKSIQDKLIDYQDFLLSQELDLDEVSKDWQDYVAWAKNLKNGIVG